MDSFFSLLFLMGKTYLRYEHLEFLEPIEVPLYYNEKKNKNTRIGQRVPSSLKSSHDIIIKRIIESVRGDSLLVPLRQRSMLVSSLDSNYTRQPPTMVLSQQRLLLPHCES